jgi:hypothetical protein
VTDWTDPELNPLGLKRIDERRSLPARIKVAVEVAALAYFESANGTTYLCAYVDERRSRQVYVLTPDGFVEVTDPTIKFIVGKWTDEIVDSRRV